MASHNRWCNRCQRNVRHDRDQPNHVLHLLLTVFTFGFWIVIWLLAGFCSLFNHYFCAVCGARYAKPITVPSFRMMSDTEVALREADERESGVYELTADDEL